MAKAYICGVLERQADGRYLLTAINIYSEGASTLTCVDGRCFCDFGIPFEDSDYERATELALPYLDCWRKAFRLSTAPQCD